MSEPARCTIEQLRSLFLFDQLSDEQLAALCTRGRSERYEPGVVFGEGEPATNFYVLLEGEITLSQRVGADEVETARTAQRGAYAGAWAPLLSGVGSDSQRVTMRAVTPVHLFVIAASEFAALIGRWFPTALHLLEGVFYGNRSAQHLVGERERLLSLGSLSAGLTHELNNPAAAAVRATAALRERLSALEPTLASATAHGWDGQQLRALNELQEQAIGQARGYVDMTALQLIDREDELADWLTDHDIPNSGDIAPTLAQAGLQVNVLERLRGSAGDEMLEAALRWLAFTLETEMLLGEIEESTSRVSALVTAAKQYTQLDRAPQQVLDVHELLDSTVMMLHAKFGDVRLIKEYDRALPAVPVYGAELNQVWTNLIDNALQAMQGSGSLTLRTSLAGDFLEVDVADTGPGIAADVIDRVFEPFFTTKPVGQGTGLGLDISWRIVVTRHHGALSVTSAPGDTQFRVLLPLHPWRCPESL